MSAFHTLPFRRNTLALTIGLALCAPLPYTAHAADGADGSAATADASAQGGHGGDMDLTTGAGGNGGAGEPEGVDKRAAMAKTVMPVARAPQKITQSRWHSSGARS